jgi:hypothetical protein
MQTAGSSGKFRCGLPNVPDKKKTGQAISLP